MDSRVLTPRSQVGWTQPGLPHATKNFVCRGVCVCSHCVDGRQCLRRRAPWQYVPVCILKTILPEPLVRAMPFGAAQPIRVNGAMPERNGRVASMFRCALKSRFGQRPVAIQYLARSYPKFQPKPPHTTCSLHIAVVSSQTPYSLPAHSACVATRWLSNLIHCALLKRPVSQQIGSKPTGLVIHWPNAT